MTTFTSCFVRAQTVGLDSTTQQEGVRELDVPLMVSPLRWFFCLLGRWVLPFCSLYSPLFGCFGLYMILRVSSPLPESSQIFSKPFAIYKHVMPCERMPKLCPFFSLEGHLWFWNSRGIEFDALRGLKRHQILYRNWNPFSWWFISSSILANYECASWCSSGQVGFDSLRVILGRSYIVLIFDIWCVWGTDMLLECPGRKTLWIKIKDGNPSVKSARQMWTQVDTTQTKNKSKQSTKKYIYQVKTLCKENTW